MWSSRTNRLGGVVAVVLALTAIQGCSIEALNATKPVSGTAQGGTVNAVLAGTEIAPVNSREAQQVRNALLFAMNGGTLRPGGKYKVNLKVAADKDQASAQRLTRAKTVGRVQIKAEYTMTEKRNGAFVASGTRTALATYDRTPQSFANQRAERDAVDRAAKDVAQQIRLTLAQVVAEL